MWIKYFDLINFKPDDYLSRYFNKLIIQEEEEYRVHFFLDVAGYFRRNEDTFQITSGLFLLTRQKDHYSIHPSGVQRSSLYYLIAIHPDGDDPEILDYIESTAKEKPFQINTANRFIFDQIFGRFHSANPNKKKSSLYLLLSIILNLENKNPHVLYNPEFREIIDKAISYMNEHIYGSLHLESLGNHLNLSEKYFIKLFKSQTGLPPMKYFSRLRIEEAIKLIMNSNKTLSSIAEELRFSSIAHFSKVFKQYTSLTPVQYRNNYINSLEKQNERSLKEIEKAYNLLQKIIDSTPDLIFFKDIHYTYLGCNRAFCDFVGMTKERIIGYTDKELFTKEMADFFVHKDYIIFTTNRAYKNQELLTYPDGQKKLIEVFKAPFHDADGNILGLIGISREITKREK